MAFQITTYIPMHTMFRLVFISLMALLTATAYADIDQECALGDPKIQTICKNDHDRQAAITLNKWLLYSLAQPKNQDEFESALKWKNSWRGIVSQCLQLKQYTEYGSCMTLNMQRFNGILASQYPEAEIRGDSEKLRILALDRIKVLVAESKKRSDDCLADVIRKVDDRISAPIEAGRTAFASCRTKIHSYMRVANDTYVIDDFLMPISLTTEESLASTEELIYTNDMLSQLVMDIRAKTSKVGKKPVKTKKDK